MKLFNRFTISFFLVVVVLTARAETKLTPAMINAYNTLPSQKIAELYVKFNADPAFKKAGFQDGLEAIVACFVGGDQRLKSVDEKPNEHGNLMEQELYSISMSKKICGSRANEMVANGVVTKDRVKELVMQYNQMYAKALANIQGDQGKALLGLTKRSELGSKLTNGVFSDYVAMTVR